MSSSQISLNGQVAVITGGTGAIGSSFSRGLLAAGAKVAVLGRGKTVPVDTAVKSIDEKAAGSTLRGYACDVSKEEQVNKVFDQITDDLGIPTILVNAAGGNKGKAAFVDVDIDIFSEVVEMNLIGGLVVPTKHMVRRWKKEKIRGSIINIASMASYLPLSDVWAYAASKAGVVNLTAGLAKEFAADGIRINAIAPGFFIGNQNKNLLYSNYDKGELSPRGKSIIDRTPFGRFGDLEELNGTLLYLCDPALSGFVTGVTIPVDGGYLIDNV